MELALERIRNYDGEELDDQGMDSEHDNWRGQWSQFDVYHNKK